MSRFLDLHKTNETETPPTQTSSEAGHEKPGGIYFDKKMPDGRIVLTEDAAYEATGFSFPTWKKWYILSVIAFIQYSMNFNTSGECYKIITVWYAK